MPSSEEDASLTWKPGAVPVSIRFNDPYYALEDGLGESRHVFLEGNDLTARWHAGAAEELFEVAELGFGTGLNFCATMAHWAREGPARGRLAYTAFERYPLPGAALARALGAWPELGEIAAALMHAWPGLLADGGGTAEIAGAQLTLIIGDARGTLAAWEGAADAWYLDGFAPRKNPEMWEPGLLLEVWRHTRPGGSFATYSAAGDIRRSLAGAGFVVQKRPGFGRKRDMTTGRR